MDALADEPESHGISVPQGRREYLVYCAAQGISAVGTWMQKAAIGWLTWEMTHSAAWVGAMALTDVISACWVGPLAGAVADRTNPFHLMQATQILSLIVAGTLAILAGFDILNVYGLFALALMDSTIQGFNQPVRMGAITFLATRERLPQAIATNSIAFNLARVIGPAIAGGLMVAGDPALVFATNSVSFLATIAAIHILKAYLNRPVSRETGGLGAEILDGYRYIATAPEMVIIFLLAITFSFLVRPFTELLPALTGSIFLGGPGTLATLMSAQGLGGLIGGVFMLTRRRSTTEMIGTTYATGFGLALILVVFSSTSDLRLGAGLMVAAGICHVLCNIGMQSMVQILSDDAYRGRVLALYGLLFRTAPSAGAFAIGMGTHWIGLQWLIGAAAVVAGSVIVCLLPGARRLLRLANAAA